ncbi:hypothetical protein PoB_007463600 [Plakobranchus ocellatus]|uniref:Uncharacterized protein n=1 Tax=Plakobranchus ocellatus TaxID=259542 RepID=A0AAV4DW43_9GAST|nr:hypothetical protein PoB_007463600 [Plakobranchus ocellatus]
MSQLSSVCLPRHLSANWTIYLDMPGHLSINLYNLPGSASSPLYQPVQPTWLCLVTSLPTCTIYLALPGHLYQPVQSTWFCLVTSLPSCTVYLALPLHLSKPVQYTWLCLVLSLLTWRISLTASSLLSQPLQSI